MAFIYEFTNTTNLGTVKFVNVMHFKKVDGSLADLTAINAVVGKIKSQFYDQWSSYYPAGVQFICGQKVMAFEDTSPASKFFVPSTSVLSIGGTGSGLPGQLAVCMRWISDLPTRQGRGRTFCGPLNSAAISGPSLSPGAITAFAAAGNLLWNAIGGVGSLTPAWQFGVWSKVGGQFHPILAGNTDGVIDTLRSRKY